MWKVEKYTSRLNRRCRWLALCWLITTCRLELIVCFGCRTTIKTSTFALFLSWEIAFKAGLKQLNYSFLASYLCYEEISRQVRDVQDNTRWIARYTGIFGMEEFRGPPDQLAIGKGAGFSSTHMRFLLMLKRHSSTRLADSIIWSAILHSGPGTTMRHNIRRPWHPTPKRSTNLFFFCYQLFSLLTPTESVVKDSFSRPPKREHTKGKNDQPLVKSEKRGKKSNKSIHQSIEFPALNTKKKLTSIFFLKLRIQVSS